MFLRGGVASNRNDTDHEYVFRQESYFSFLFGVDEPDWYGAIDITSGNCTLFMPRLPKEYAIWMGEIKGPEHFVALYELDFVKYVDEIEASLPELAGGHPVHTMQGVNTDSGVNIKDVLPVDDKIPSGLTTNTEFLFQALAECRVLKTPDELDLMRYVSWITSVAHVEVID